MKEALKDIDIKHAADLIQVEPAVIRAVLEVETSNKGGFIDETDKPVILFEGHIFWKQLKQRNIDPLKYANSSMYSDIVYPKWTKEHYKGGIAEWNRLNRAICINKEAALESASWGLTQIMGFNYKMCDCKDVNEFVSKMEESEASQLELFIRFIRNNRMDCYLRNKDWKGFSRSYNGSGYAQNKYDEKLEKSFIHNKILF